MKDLMYKNMGPRLSCFLMFEKWTKKLSQKATDSALEGAAQSLNDRIGQYGDIIQIGLVLGVIVLGTRHLTRDNQRRFATVQSYLPAQTTGGQPIIVNNYYREREDRFHEQRNKQYCYIQDNQVKRQSKGQTYSKR